ncbi:MAG: hypothetical protein JWQ27_3183 [Ferruginibacter sp.]|nr:hypothetical protein [Ferruginibacter sp.]
MELMEQEFDSTEFSKSVLAGLFAGIAATVLSLIFNSYFRLYTHYPLSELVNVSTIIFSLVLIVTIAGFIFYLFHHYMKRGAIVYQFVWVAVTALLIMFAMQVQRSADPLQTKQFRELLTGVILITGACTIFMVPLLYKKDVV